MLRDRFSNHNLAQIDADAILHRNACVLEQPTQPGLQHQRTCEPVMTEEGRLDNLFHPRVFWDRQVR